MPPKRKGVLSSRARDWKRPPMPDSVKPEQQIPTLLSYYVGLLGLPTNHRVVKEVTSLAQGISGPLRASDPVSSAATAEDGKTRTPTKPSITRGQSRDARTLSLRSTQIRAYNAEQKRQYHELMARFAVARDYGWETPNRPSYQNGYRSTVWKSRAFSVYSFGGPIPSIPVIRCSIDDKDDIDAAFTLISLSRGFQAAQGSEETKLAEGSEITLLAPSTSHSELSSPATSVPHGATHSFTASHAYPQSACGSNKRPATASFEDICAATPGTSVNQISTPENALKKRKVTFASVDKDTDNASASRTAKTSEYRAPSRRARPVDKSLLKTRTAYAATSSEQVPYFATSSDVTKSFSLSPAHELKHSNEKPDESSLAWKTKSAPQAVPPRSCPHRMNMLEHFELHKPHPVGVWVPVDAAQSQWHWQAYRHAVSFDNPDDVKALNRWRGQHIRRKTQALGIKQDLRAKGEVRKHAGCVFI